MKPRSVPYLPGRAFARAAVLLLSLSGLCGWSEEAFAIAKYARATGSWGAAGTWSTNPDCTTVAATAVPTAADAVTICPGVTVTVAAPAVALSVDVQGTLTQTASTLTISGPLNVAGTHTCGNTLSVAGATTVPGLLTISATTGTKTFTGNVTINGGTWSETAAEAIAFGGNLQNDGTLTASTGVHTFSGAARTFSGANPIVVPSVAVTGTRTNNGTLTVATALSGAGTLTNGINATLNIGNTATVTTLNASASPNTVNYYRAGNQTLKAATYHHLTLSGSGTKSTGAITLQVNGTTTVTGTATFNISSTTGTKTFVGPVVVNPNCSWTNTANEPVVFRGGITHNGTTFSSGTGLQTFNTNIQALAGGSAMTFGGAVTVTGPISLTNNNSNTVTITGTLNGTVAGSSTFVNGTNATLNYGAAAAPMATGVLTASASPNTVNYNRANTQTIRATTYHHLTLSGTSAKTAAAGLTVNGNFTQSGSAGFTAGAFTHNFYGNWVVNTTAAAPLTAATTSLINFNTPAVPAATSMGGTTTATIAFADVNINNTSGVTFNDNASFSAGTTPTLTVAANATLTPAAAVIISGTGTLTGGGTAQVTRTTAGTANFSSQYTIATKTLTNLTVEYIGAAAQTVSVLTYGSATGGGLKVNNTSGVSLTANTTVAGTLTLASGVVATGAFTLIGSGNCTTKVARTGGHVAGLLQLAFPTGAPSCTFHVGDATTYRPINASFASVTVAGSMAGMVSQAAGEHPNIATSGLDSAKDVNRYWTLTNPAGGTIAFTTYTGTFNFINPGDFDVGATPASFEIERWDGAAWNTTTLGTAGATSTSASGLPSFAAGSSHSFAVGQKKGLSVVSINLASADPTSPATSVDWTVTFSASVTGVDATDFVLVAGGSVTGASITGVSGSGTIWTVTANTGTGAGTLGLNLVDDDTILAGLVPLGGAGAGNGNFTGQVYTVVYTASGFAFTDSACVHNIAFGAPGQTCALLNWSPQLAGQNLAGVYVTSINTSGVPTRLHATQNRTRNIQFGLSCHNPATNAGVQATFAGVTLPLCQASGATPASWSTAVTVTFPGGSPSSNVSYTFNYADVGSVEHWMRNSAITTEIGNSGIFVVKPYGFTVSVAGNPAAADATGAAFVKAGASFSATVTATANGGAATPNYGKESTAEGVKLTAALVPGLGLTNLPALSNAMIAGSEFGSGGMVVDANGIATVTNLAWNEVGIIRLTPSVADASYLGAGDVTGTVSANVGRFYPDHFTLSAGSITTRTDVSPACSPASTFSYMNEPFQAGFTLTASGPSPGNATLLNYVSSATPVNKFAKLATGSPIPAGFGFAYLNTATNLTTRVDSSLGITGDWAAGALAAVATLGFTRAAAPDGPYSAMKVGIAPADSDGVVLSVLNMDVTAPAGNDHAEVGETQIRFGRLRLLNAYGSELLPLRVPVRAEYFNVTNWTVNADDSCTSLLASAFFLSGGIAANTSASAVALSAGIGTLTLAKPSPVAAGSVDVAANLGASGSDQSCLGSHGGTFANMPWLRGFWAPAANCNSTAAWAQDPNARVKFGSPKAPYIYLRERY